MEPIRHYIQEVLGIDIKITPLEKKEQGALPYYITQAFHFYKFLIYNHEFVLADLQHDQFNIAQLKQQLQIIRKTFNKKIVLVVPQLTALDRRRLIHAGINFVAPGHQFFLPDLMINLNESHINKKRKQKAERLLPSAQFILLYYILHPDEKKKIEEYTFKELSKKFDYTQMAITKAVENLLNLELCEVKGTKEKYIHLKYPQRNELWKAALPKMVNPVLKKVFVDEKPEKNMLFANTSALPEYSDMNPGKQEYYAIEKNAFYALQKAGRLVNENEYEGKYCLEVWKYDPLKLTIGITEEGSVDPLSLYLSLKDSHDERIEMALEQILKEYTW